MEQAMQRLESAARILRFSFDQSRTAGSQWRQRS
jgi:hypothetical protein